MNLCSERMLDSARLGATAQLGRLCKKSVRADSRGVRGGSLSKKLRLNHPQTCVRKVRGRFPGPWPHFRGAWHPVLRPWRRGCPVCTQAHGYRPVLHPWRRSIDAAVFAHCAAHSGVAVWQLQQSIPMVRAWRDSPQTRQQRVPGVSASSLGCVTWALLNQSQGEMRRHIG